MRVIALFLSLFCIAAKAASQHTIYVYADKGVSSEALEQTLHSTKATLNKEYNIKTIKAKAVKEGKWRKDAALFIMPGGADIPYVKALNEKGNEQIKAYVQEGGAYLGICAGSYYGSQDIIFAKGTPIEVTGPRELAFFKGTAVGPALAPFDTVTYKGTRAANLVLSNNKEATVLFFGGNFFEAKPMPKNTTIIARYKDLPQQPPAIIRIRVGSGTVVLSGVHFEYNHSQLNSKDPYLAMIIPTLKSHDNERLQLTKSIFSELGLHVAQQ